MFGLRNQGFGDAEVSREALEWIQLAGFGKFANVYPDEYPSAKKQRVAIAEQLAAKPRILLMDEPSGPGRTNAIKMQSYLLEIWRHLDITVLFITHDLDEQFTWQIDSGLDANPGRVNEGSKLRS